MARIVYNIMLRFFIGIGLSLLIGCSSSPVGAPESTRTAAFLAARPILEKIFQTGAPIAPSDGELFPTVLSNGTLSVLAGDYLVPVMSYCMKGSGSSPSAHRYALGKLMGKRAGIIRDLNARALEKFSAKDVQSASWVIQSGVSYEEMPEKTQKIIDFVIPQHRQELRRSFLKRLSETWDKAASATGQPSFEVMTEERLGELGEVGERIRALRVFLKRLRESGDDYDSLRSLIHLPGKSDLPGDETTTPWSRISENIYIRFLTSGHYLEVGQLQIRVLEKGRSPQGTKNSLVSIDLSSLIADPGSADIQPLSFSALLGPVAVDVLSARVSAAIAAAVIAAILAEKYVDWDAFSKAAEKFGDLARDLIQNGTRSLSKEHDRLEKPLRDAGIVSGRAKERFFEKDIKKRLTEEF